MILLSLCASAFAESMVYSQSLNTSFSDLFYSKEREEIVALSSEQLYLLSTKDWSLSGVAPCGTFSASGVDVSSDGDLYIGCSDGSISMYDTALQTNAFALEEASSVLSINIKEKQLYALAEQESGGNPRLHHIDLSTQIESTGSFPSTLGYSSYKDSEIVSNFLIVSHGGNNLSKVDLSSGSPTRDDQGPTSPTYSDVLRDVSAANALVAGGTGGVVLFQLSSNNTQLSLSGNDWGEVTALAAGEGSLWIADEQSNSIKEVSYTMGSAAPGNEILQEVALNGITSSVLEMADLGEYLVFVTDGGDYGVITDNPWVTATMSDTATLMTGDSYTFSFSGTHQVVLIEEQ